MKESIRIGVTGYCPPTMFDETEALRMLKEAYDRVTIEHPNKSFTVVSGLTAVGVLKLAYEEAVRRGWRTEGIACRQAEEHPLFPVDKKKIVGDNWGDESQEFLRALDCMVRIGIGEQSRRECAIIRECGLPTYEYDLQRL